MREVIKVTFTEFTDGDFKPPSTYYFKCALGFFNFIKGRDRLALQSWVDEEYGKGKYKLNAAKQGKSSGTESAVGRLSSFSRKGMRTKGNE